MKYPPVQVLDAPRPSNAPADFIDWQFAFVKDSNFPDEIEDKLCQSIAHLLFAYLPLQFRKPLKDISRFEARAVAVDINAHCQDLLSVLLYVASKAQKIQQGET